MKSHVALLLIVTFALATARWAKGVAEGERPFTIYDNMFYQGKPDTAREGMVASNILYENNIWPHKEDYGVLPKRSAFRAIVRAHIANPGPLVLDIERLPLKGSPEAARHNLKTLATLADWAHEAAPGKVIGFYGTNTLSKVPPSDLPYVRELARHVDAFLPSMYTFDDDRAAWEKRARASAAEARELDPHKPIYFYLWPQYHDGTVKQFQYIDAAYWKFQLETAYHYSNGIVLWGPSRYAWNDTTGWWSATQKFAHKLRTHRLAGFGGRAGHESVRARLPQSCSLTLGKKPQSHQRGALPPAG